jgi:hypothetical protein
MGIDYMSIAAYGAIGYGIYYAYKSDCHVYSDGTKLNFLDWATYSIGIADEGTTYSEVFVTSPEGVKSCGAIA